MHLWDELTNARNLDGRLVAWAGSELVENSWGEVLRRAGRKARALRRAGVAPGTPVATILTNSPQAVSGILAIWWAGGTVASLPVPARGMTLDEYRQQIEKLCADLGAPLLLTDPAVAAVLDLSPAAWRIRSWDDLPDGNAVEPTFPEPDEIAFVQYSSGSTARPKGCMLTTKAIGCQLDMLADALAMEPVRDRGVSWLPLSHDMGLFGALLFMWAHGCDLLLSSPERFLSSPRSWFADCSEFRATLTVGPNSALNLAARAGQRARLSDPLVLKACIVGAERVDWQTLVRTCDTYGPYGLRFDNFVPAYGLAEATLAVTSVPISVEPTSLVVDSDALVEGKIVEHDRRAGDNGLTTEIVSTGIPLKGVSVAAGHEGAMGEIGVQSPSLFSSYFADPEQTNRRLTAGEFWTGDLGFVAGGELYVVGRLDDLVSVGGRNVYTREIETAIGEHRDLRTGCCIIVDVPASFQTRLVALAELYNEGADCNRLASLVARTATDKAGITLHECLFLRKGHLPKTPSGKLQRFRCRQLIASGRLQPIARVSLVG